MKLPPGKIPINLLREVVFKNLGAPRKEVTLGPTTGVDSAVIDTDQTSIIVSMDPITGAQEHIGYLAVNVNANDIATFGVQPAFLFSCLMLPEGADQTIVETISTQMHTAAKNLNMAIVGGHAESTPQLTHPIVVGCAMGTTKKGNYVTAANAKPGDNIILTKSAGIEGTAILASDKQTQLQKTLTKQQLETAKNFYQKISIVKDALTAYNTGGVHAMHDPTEGGIAGGIHEMADASNLGVKINRNKIKIEPETTKICHHFNIDPIQLISSGVLLIAAQKEKTKQIIQNLKQKQIQAAVIGEFVPDKNHRKLTADDGEAQDLPRPTSDHLWKALNPH